MDVQGNEIALARDLLDTHRSAVAQHLGDALHDFGSVIAHADHGVGTHHHGVANHFLEGLLASLFAQVGEQGDVPANDSLQAGANGSKNGAGAHNNAAHQAQVMRDAVSVQDERCSDEIVGHRQIIPRPKAYGYLTCPQLVTTTCKQQNSTLHFQVLSDDTYMSFIDRD